MVIFDQLRLSDDGQRMYINVHVNSAEYFDGVYLDSIVIMTSDKVLETTTATQYPTDDYGNPKDCIYSHTFCGSEKCADLVLTANDFLRSYETNVNSINFKQSDMSKTLFFVYVKCKGTVSSCTPCKLDELVTVGVTFDEKLLYQKVMDYTKSLGNDCKVPVGFTDFILLWNAFKACIETDHYVPAIKYWNMLFGKEGYYVSNVTSSGCGCHG